MKLEHKRPFMQILKFVVLVSALGAIVLLNSEAIMAQTVATPIARHVVVRQAYRFTIYQGGLPEPGVPYHWGGYDWIDNLGTTTAGCSSDFANWVEYKLQIGCTKNCTTLESIGDDCSGYVMRVWGQRISEAKWGTDAIAWNSTLIPYQNRNADLLLRMRMGDVFDNKDYCGGGCHVVLLHYFNPSTGNPVFYEENPNVSCVAHENSGGWAWLDNPVNGGWWRWDAQRQVWTGYRPYRYLNIRDDIYIPWLSNGWPGTLPGEDKWYTTLLSRNNNTHQPAAVLEHSLYSPAGDDNGAVFKMNFFRRDLNRDIWELPTSRSYLPDFLGGGVSDADAGTGAVVYFEDTHSPNSKADIYTGIYPVSNLGLASGTNLSMPIFYSGFEPGNYTSKIFVQNASGQSASFTAFFYSLGPNGVPNDCTYPGPTLAPWGTAALNPGDCTGFPYPDYATIGSVRITSGGGKPMAAIILHLKDGGGSGVAANNAVSRGYTLLSAPTIFHSYFDDWYTTLHVENMSSNPARITIAYYPPGGRRAVCQEYIPSLPSYRQMSFSHGPGGNSCLATYGQDQVRYSAVIGSNFPVAVVVDQESPSVNAFRAYNAVPGRNNVLIPFVRNGRAPEWGDTPWAGDFVIHNPTGVTTAVSLHYYDQSGRSVQCPVGHCYNTIQPYGSWEVYPGHMPDPFSGSVEINATGNVKIAAEVNMFYGELQDGAVGYSATEMKTAYEMAMQNTPPSSEMMALPAYSGETFEVTWYTDDEMAALASYDIQACQDNCEDSGAIWADWLTRTVDTSATFTGEPGHTYYFRCRARDYMENLEDWPANPGYDAFTAVDLTPPSSQVSALPTYSLSDLLVSWSGNDPAPGSGSGLYYDVQYSVGGGSWIDWLTQTTALSATFSNGQSGQTYSFRCRALDYAENQENWPSTPDASTTVDALAPSSQVSALPAYSPKNLTVSWSGSDPAPGSGLVSYDLQYCTTDCMSGWTTWLDHITATSHLFTGEDGVTYYFRSRARDALGNLETYPSTADTSTTVDDQPPSTYVSTFSPLYGSSPFTVYWQGTDGLSGIDRYGIYYRDESTENWTFWLTSTNSSASFTGSAGHTYHFCSLGVDHVGNHEMDCPSTAGANWPIISDAQRGVTPWSRVNALPATVGSNQFTVSWSGSSAGMYYDVQVRDRTLGGNWTTWKSNVQSTSAQYTGQYDHIYEFRSRGRTSPTLWEVYPYSYDTYTKPVQGGLLGGGSAPAVSVPPDEAPDLMEEVTHTEVLGVPIAGLIAPEEDVDWYRFEVTETMRVRVWLDQLPADYDLYVYDGTGQFLGASTRGRALSDEVVVRVPAGVYYLQVVGYAGAWNSETSYQLLIERVQQ